MILSTLMSIAFVPFPNLGHVNLGGHVRLLFIVKVYSLSFVTQFGKTKHNARLLIFSYKPTFAKNIFFGEEAFFDQVIMQ